MLFRSMGMPNKPAKAEERAWQVGGAGAGAGDLGATLGLAPGLCQNFES